MLLARLGQMLAIAFLLTAASAAGATSGSSARPSNLPVLTLKGARVVDQPLGKRYVDAGAKAKDPKEGDISGRIKVKGLSAVDVHAVGDYVVRYDVTNARGKKALEVVRIVRVHGIHFALQSARPLGATGAGMGYFEHLPTDYAKNQSRKFPLLIWNHGYGNSRDFGDHGNELAFIDGIDIFRLIQSVNWDASSPLIVLMPQRNSRDVYSPGAYTQMAAFVAYAVRTYNVDESRIYMAGFSDGAFFTWEYLRRNPEQLAAAVPIAGYDLAVLGCTMTSTPVWAFQNQDDSVVYWENTLATVEGINLCEPSERARFTLFPAGGHSPQLVLNPSYVGEGDPAYDLYEPYVFSWLLEHHR